MCSRKTRLSVRFLNHSLLRLEQVGEPQQYFECYVLCTLLPGVCSSADPLRTTGDANMDVGV